MLSKRFVNAFFNYCKCLLSDFYAPASCSIFNSMTKKQSLLSLLVVTSLLAILMLQAIFLYQNYQERLIDFKNDVDLALEVTMPDIKKDRSDRIYELYLEELNDTSIIETDLNRTDSTLVVQLIEKTTKDLLMFFTIHLTEANEYLFAPDSEKRMSNIFQTLKSNYVYVGLTEEIDARVASYQDTLSLNYELLRERLDGIFSDKDMYSDYELELRDEGDSLWATHHSGVVSEPYDLKYGEPEQVLYVVFEKPFLSVLGRLLPMLIASLAVLVLVLVSFRLLMRTLNKQRRLSQLKDDFIDQVTHELLTPIATLKLSLETLQHKQVRHDEAKSLEYLRLSGIELNRISDIVNNVLYTSLQDQQETVLTFQQVNVNELLEELLKYHQNRSDKAVKVNFNADKVHWVNTDRQHLTNVLHNLVDNTIKYATDEPVLIQIDLKQSGKALELTLSDNGIGIAKGHEEKIFEKFHRAVDLQQTTVRGLGIGLYYVRTILARMNGSIKLLDSPQQGATFKVSLPLTNA